MGSVENFTEDELDRLRLPPGKEKEEQINREVQILWDAKIARKKNKVLVPSRMRTFLALLVLAAFIFTNIYTTVVGRNINIEEYPCNRSDALWKYSNSTTVQSLAAWGDPALYPGPRNTYTYTLQNAFLGASSGLTIVGLISSLIFKAKKYSVVATISKIVNFMGALFGFALIIYYLISYLFFCNSSLMPWGPCVAQPYYYCVNGLASSTAPLGTCYTCYDDASSFVPNNVTQITRLVPTNFWFDLVGTSAGIVLQFLLLYFSAATIKASEEYVRQHANPYRTINKLIRKRYRMIRNYTLVCLLNIGVFCLFVYMVQTKPSSSDWNIIFANFHWVMLNIVVTVRFIPPMLVLFALKEPTRSPWWTALRILQSTILFVEFVTVVWIIVQLAACTSDTLANMCYVVDGVGTSHVAEPFVWLAGSSVLFIVFQVLHIMQADGFKKMNEDIAIKQAQTKIKIS